MSIIPFNNDFFILKTAFMKSIPPFKLNKINSIYFHNCTHKDMCVIWSLLFKNLKKTKNNLQFARDYILNCFDSYDLIIINDFKDDEEININYINRFLDILEEKGEIWFFSVNEEIYEKFTNIIHTLKIKFYEKKLSSEKNVFLKALTVCK